MPTVRFTNAGFTLQWKGAEKKRTQGRNVNSDTVGTGAD